MKPADLYLFLGLKRFVKDIEVMLDIKLGVYWKITWAFVIPTFLMVVFIYALTRYEPEDIGKSPYPSILLGKFTNFRI